MTQKFILRRTWPPVRKGEVCEAIVAAESEAAALAMAPGPGSWRALPVSGSAPGIVKLPAPVLVSGR